MQSASSVWVCVCSQSDQLIVNRLWINFSLIGSWNSVTYCNFPFILPQMSPANFKPLKKHNYRNLPCALTKNVPTLAENVVLLSHHNAHGGVWLKNWNTKLKVLRLYHGFYVFKFSTTLMISKEIFMSSVKLGEFHINPTFYIIGIINI